MAQPLFAPASGPVARVALPVPVDRLFDYRLPAPLARDALPGCRVQVRFRKRHLTGVIVERPTSSSFGGRLLPVEKLVDAEPVLPESLLDWLREAAAEFLCPIGLALATALPPGSAPRVLRGYALTPRGREALERGAISGPARRVLERVERAPLGVAALRRRAAEVAGRERGAGLLRELERDGLLRARIVERAPTARPATLRSVELARDVDVEAACRGPLARAPRQADLLRRLARDGATPSAALQQEFRGAAALVRALRQRKLVRVWQRPAPRDVLGIPLEPPREVELTPEQAAVLAPIAAAVRARRAEGFLLHGVTGSGKTEVYLRAVGEALAMGRQALVLVPEITLTHQILARLRGRFGDDLAVLHSGLRPGERLEQWLRLRRGSTPIAVGARSALFAPLENLGVIVMDEEQDDAYKNDEGFRYHARRLAELRAERAGCPLVLGSATPSLETRYAADEGRLRRLVLPNRIGDRPLPAVSFVDLERERALAPRGRKLILSHPLLRAMRETLGEGGQVILFLNRRGFSTQILCFDCGHAERCRDCDISLVYHADGQVLRCHYCDYRMPPPERCSGCGAPATALLGVGTQRVEEEARSAFPEARIARLDRDSAGRRGHTESVLRGLRDGRLDIVVGTQMVAKGHDFPGVRLVGVVLADLGLHQPDFRAGERTLQVLTQVAGRAGRDAAPGRVVIQTFAPKHYAIAPVARHDYEAFYREELAQRRALGYPPCGSLVHAVVSAAQLGRAQQAARALADALQTGGLVGAASGVELLGPAPAPLARLRGRHRVQLLAKGAERAAVRRAAQALLAAAARLPEAVQASVDANPTNML
jgi:primosomal protein N' (replication factor Y)